MINSTTIEVFGSALGNVLGFAAKQSVVFHGMDAVRKELDRCVHETAVKYMGTPYAPSARMAELLTIPAVCAIGDVVWTCVSQGILSAITIAGRISGLVKDEMNVSIFSRTAVGMISSTCGYAWKYIVAICASPIVKVALERLSVLSSTLFPAALIAYAPAITIVLGDVGGFILTEIIYHVSLHVISRMER